MCQNATPYGDGKEDDLLVRGPEWLPVTFNLNLELPLFLDHYIKRKRRCVHIILLAGKYRRHILIKYGCMYLLFLLPVKYSALVLILCYNMLRTCVPLPRLCERRSLIGYSLEASKSNSPRIFLSYTLLPYAEKTLYVKVGF